MKSLLTMSVGCLLLLQFTWASQEESPELAAESRDEVRELEDSFNEEVGVRLSTQPSDSVIGGPVMLVADFDSQDGERNGRDASHESFGERGGEFSHDEEHEHSCDGRHEHFGDEEHEHFHYETHDDFGRTAPSERRRDASDAQSLRRRLHSEFELQERRQMQQLEFLRRRLETIERRIESRRRNRDRIIERRLEQALDRPRAANRHGFDFGREEEDIEIRREAERVIEENRREVERQAMSRQLRHSELLAHAEELQTQHDELDKMRAILMRRFNPGK